MATPVLGRLKDHERRFALMRTSAAEDEMIVKSLPPEISYSSIVGVRPNQTTYGCCVAEASTTLMQAESVRHSPEPIAMSVSATYAQALRDTSNGGKITDSGLPTGAGLASYQTHGYVPNAKRPFPHPNDESYMLAPVDPSLWVTTFKEHTYAAVDADPISIWRALYTRGPVQIGCEWANEWFTPGADGVLPPPLTDANGGHSLVIVGINMTTMMFEIANSWGVHWGCQPPGAESGGFCWLPISYYSNPAYKPYWPTDLYVVSMS
jgi:hypothetical protein